MPQAGLYQCFVECTHATVFRKNPKGGNTSAMIYINPDLTLLDTFYIQKYPFRQKEGSITIRACGVGNCSNNLEILIICYLKDAYLFCYNSNYQSLFIISRYCSMLTSTRITFSNYRMGIVSTNISFLCSGGRNVGTECPSLIVHHWIDIINLLLISYIHIAML